MAPIYVNTSASAPIAQDVHNVFRVTLQRALLSAPLFASGIIRWRDVVQTTLDRSASPAGFPLSGAFSNVSNNDDVAVVDYRGGSNPGAATVGDLVRAIDAASAHSTVIKIESVGRVPIASAGGAEALRRGEAAEQDAAREKAEAESLAARVGDVIEGVVGYGKVLGVVAVIVLVAGAIYLYAPRKAPPAAS